MLAHFLSAWDKQCEGSSSGERNIDQANAETTLGRREKDTIPEVGNCIEFKTPKAAAGQPPVERPEEHEPRNRECSHCCEACQVRRARAGPQGELWSKLHDTSTEK